MKKNIFLAIALCVMFAFAASADDVVPSIRLTPGTETEIVFNREIRLENLGVDADLSAQYYDVTLEIKLAQWLTITPKAGFNTSQANIGIGGGDIELNSGLGWNIGVDAQADIYSLNINDVNYVDFALIGGYRFSRVDLDEIDLGGITISNPFETIVTMHEWELGGKVSRELQDFVGFSLRPYFGIVYSDLKGDADINLSVLTVNEDISAKDNFGLRAGFAAEPIKDLIVALDVKLVDQTAIIVSAAYRF